MGRRLQGAQSDCRAGTDRGDARLLDMNKQNDLRGASSSPPECLASVFSTTVLLPNGRLLKVLRLGLSETIRELSRSASGWERARSKESGRICTWATITAARRASGPQPKEVFHNDRGVKPRQRQPRAAR